MIVDTGFLVALYIQRDSLHDAAVGYLKSFVGDLHTVPAVVVETCFFLDTRGKCALLRWISKGGLIVHEITVEAYAEISSYIEKYADQDMDFADANLVWLANQLRKREILTVDKTDFSIYRLRGNQPFVLTAWY